MNIASVSEQGLVRDNNEDSFAIKAEQGLFIVADGMGGHAAGEQASNLAVQTVVDLLQGDWQQEPELRIEAAIKGANSAILARSTIDAALIGMGTTLTVAAVRPDCLLTGQIGDSAAFLADSEGLKLLTGDHSVSGQLLALGKITDAEAARHPQRHVLTRALGIDPWPEIEVRRHSWRPGQMLLLCTDGLTEVVSKADIWRELQADASLEHRLKRLLDLVFERGAPDNVTIILAQL